MQSADSVRCPSTDQALCFAVAECDASKAEQNMHGDDTACGQSGQPPTLQKIRVGHAHPGNTIRGLKHSSGNNLSIKV